MTSNMKTGIHRVAIWSIVLSVLMIAAGVFAIALPLLAGIAATAVIAWLLLIGGVLHIVFAWHAGRAGGVLWEILLGVVYGAAGLFVMANPVIGLESFTLVIAVYLWLKGVLELIFALQLRSTGGAGWVLLDGIVTLALAVWISITWPFSAVWVLGTVVGISMLFGGMTRLMVSNAVRRLVA